MKAQIFDLFRQVMQLCTPNYALLDLVLPHLEEEDPKKTAKFREVLFHRLEHFLSEQL